jgi:mono/diheme cytochrome c family protein
MKSKRLVVMGVVATGAALVGLAMVGLDAAADLQADPDNAAQVAQGKRIYVDQCAACHGTNLEGQPNWKLRRPDGKVPAPPHDASGHTWHHPDEQLFDITKRGTAAMVGGDYKTDMREFGSILSDEEIWAVLAYIKSAWPPEIQMRHKRMNEMRRAMPAPQVSPPQK